VIASLERLISGTTPPPPTPDLPASKAGPRKAGAARPKSQQGPRPVRPGERRRNTRAA
jgi:hypothetical protein